MELSVIIPTRDRCAILSETLNRLEEQARAVECEIIVVDDGSTDGTAEMLRQRAGQTRAVLRVLEQPGSGPAAARNRGIAAARAPVCLFINDDSWPAPGLLERHREFHARRPEQEAALLGHAGLPSRPAPSPFMRWAEGTLFGFWRIDDPQNAGGRNFFSLNVSVKTEFVRDAGGFDQQFAGASHEDIDLGMRLEARGMQLVYDRGAAIEHQHHLDLPAMLVRMHKTGRSLAQYVERHPDREVPRRPGMRHRVKAAALTTLAVAGVRTRALRHETWRFLCHEASREAYWEAVDGRGAGTREPIRIGRTLARLASRDPEVQLPTEEPDPDFGRALQEPVSASPR